LPPRSIWTKPARPEAGKKGKQELGDKETLRTYSAQHPVRFGLNTKNEKSETSVKGDGTAS
jgi:hypothetical protein